MTANYLNIEKIGSVNIGLEAIKKEHVLDKGGFVAFDWWMEQCGISVWYTLRAYLPGDIFLQIKVNV